MPTAPKPVSIKGRLVLTAAFARASATDAANMQMRKAGRTRWNEDDYNRACEKLASLLQHCEGYEAVAQRVAS